MIRAERSAGGIRMAGHAGFAPAGQDIICAAASILCEALAAGLPPEAVTLGDGYAEFRGSGADFDFVWRGLELLARSWPNHVAAVKNYPDFR